LPRPYIRLARSEDKPAILRFTEHTWDFGDYIADVWERWLREPRGKLLVSTIKRQPVAVMHVLIVAPGEAWLEGIRVNPEYRRAGLATRITRRSLREASLLGAHVVRFVTSSLNTPIHHLANELEFVRVAAIQTFEADGITHGPDSLAAATSGDLPWLQPFLQHSAVLKAMGGLSSTGWRFHNLNLQQITGKIETGQVRFLRSPEGAPALAILETGYTGEDLVISYADGEPGALADLAIKLREETARLNFKSVSVRLPEIAESRAIFLNAGYQSSEDPAFWLYEKILQ
jgi:GNAT superfamily N-acetyltransferase